MCQILLALAMDVPLPGSISNACLLQALRALMDFTFILQYPHAFRGDIGTVGGHFITLS